MATVGMMCGHAENVVKGAPWGFHGWRRSVCGHFPVNLAVQENGSFAEIRDFLGVNYIYRVHMRMRCCLFTISSSKRQMNP